MHCRMNNIVGFKFAKMRKLFISYIATLAFMDHMGVVSGSLQQVDDISNPNILLLITIPYTTCSDQERSPQEISVLNILSEVAQCPSECSSVISKICNKNGEQLILVHISRIGVFPSEPFQQVIDTAVLAPNCLFADVIKELGYIKVSVLSAVGLSIPTAAALLPDVRVIQPCLQSVVVRQQKLFYEENSMNIASPEGEVEVIVSGFEDDNALAKVKDIEQLFGGKFLEEYKVKFNDLDDALFKSEPQPIIPEVETQQEISVLFTISLPTITCSELNKSYLPMVMLSLFEQSSGCASQCAQIVGQVCQDGAYISLLVDREVSVPAAEQLQRLINTAIINPECLFESISQDVPDFDLDILDAGGLIVPDENAPLGNMILLDECDTYGQPTVEQTTALPIALDIKVAEPQLPKLDIVIPMVENSINDDDFLTNFEESDIIVQETSVSPSTEQVPLVHGYEVAYYPQVEYNDTEQTNAEVQVDDFSTQRSTQEISQDPKFEVTIDLVTPKDEPKNELVGRIAQQGIQHSLFVPQLEYQIDNNSINLGKLTLEDEQDGIDYNIDIIVSSPIQDNMYFTNTKLTVPHHEWESYIIQGFVVDDSSPQIELPIDINLAMLSADEENLDVQDIWPRGLNSEIPPQIENFFDIELKKQTFKKNNTSNKDIYMVELITPCEETLHIGVAQLDILEVELLDGNTFNSTIMNDNIDSKFPMLENQMIIDQLEHGYIPEVEDFVDVEYMGGFIQYYEVDVESRGQTDQQFKETSSDVQVVTPITEFTLYKPSVLWSDSLEEIPEQMVFGVNIQGLSQTPTYQLDNVVQLIAPYFENIMPYDEVPIEEKLEGTKEMGMNLFIVEDDQEFEQIQAGMQQKEPISEVGDTTDEDVQQLIAPFSETAPIIIQPQLKPLSEFETFSPQFHPDLQLWIATSIQAPESESNLDVDFNIYLPSPPPLLQPLFQGSNISPLPVNTADSLSQYMDPPPPFPPPPSIGSRTIISNIQSNLNVPRISQDANAISQLFSALNGNNY